MGDIGFIFGIMGMSMGILGCVFGIISFFKVVKLEKKLAKVESQGN
ncbi:hypothetical protein [Vreelandella neptunia]|uniref:Uncharacterized protein n=1 Tax=Vreelandella neptunia TaxID=115551 RepID=A0ABZ0YHG6_9GAMM|nr:hypothetical protein [Halomonas neptunia]MDN3560056.1 hypothetical protein [Halomonas neptunia]TDV87787.1 hypothetical protein BDK62_1323 [Halomonas alkaliantarctica]WQH10832.1 hypothetical protein SR894_11695 [Halomonas neptunia]